MMNLVKRVLVTVATAAAIGVSVAAPATATVRPMVGPECAPNVVTAVLDALRRNGVVLPPGTQVQYLQVIYDSSRGHYVLEPCVVTVPGS